MDDEEPTPEATDDGLDPDFLFKLKVGAAVVICLIVYKFVSSLDITPPESKVNRFAEKRKKEKPKQLEKPASGVKFLYRLARASEPSRTGRKGEPREPKVSVGVEAADMASKPWPMRAGESGYYGIAGLDTDCLHLSTAAQVVETAKLYFKGVEDVILLKFSTDSIEKDTDVILRWEAALPPPGQPARPEAFPHVYAAERGFSAKLSWWDLVACVQLPLGKDGVPTFPDDALSEENVEVPSVGNLLTGESRAAGQKLAAESRAGKSEAKSEDDPVDDLDDLEEKMRKEAGL